VRCSEHARVAQRRDQLGKMLVVATLPVLQGQIAIDDHRRRPLRQRQQPRDGVAQIRRIEAARRMLRADVRVV
jgi:hypothetical protein